MKTWFEGKKTYSGLLGVLAGLTLVLAEQKFGLVGVSDYGLALIASSGGFAAYGRYAVKPATPKKRKYNRKVKKEKPNAA